MIFQTIMPIIYYLKFNINTCSETLCNFVININQFSLLATLLDRYISYRYTCITVNILNIQLHWSIMFS